MANIDQQDWDAMKWRIHAIINDLPTVAAGPTMGEENKLHTRLNAIDAAIASSPGVPGASGPSAAEIAKAVNDDAAARLAE